MLKSIASWVELTSRGVAAYKAQDSLGLWSILLYQQQMIKTWAHGYKMAASREIKAIYLANWTCLKVPRSVFGLSTRSTGYTLLALTMKRSAATFLRHYVAANALPVHTLLPHEITRQL
jgi:hypothetical protein